MGDIFNHRNLDCTFLHFQNGWVRLYQFKFMFLGHDRHKFCQMSFENDSLRRLVPALVLEGLDHLRIRYISYCRRTRSSPATRKFLLLASDITLQTTAFITSDAIVHESHLQMRLSISHSHCKQTCLSLATNVF